MGMNDVYDVFAFREVLPNSCTSVRLCEDMLHPAAL